MLGEKWTSSMPERMCLGTITIPTLDNFKNGELAVHRAGVLSPPASAYLS